jgi:hypothetical protein
MTTQTHIHRCDRCNQRFECDGEQTQNYDGWPQVVCEWFHRRTMNLCATCDAWINGDGELEGDAIEDRSAA